MLSIKQSSYMYEKSETMASRIMMMEELELVKVVLTDYHRLGLVW